MAVAVFFTGDLGGRDFFEQRSGTTNDFLRRESQAIDAGLEVIHIGVELGGQRLQALGRVLREQRVFNAVKAGEVFGRHAFSWSSTRESMDASRSLNSSAIGSMDS